MEETNRARAVAEEIDRYRQEMLTLYRQQAAVAATDSPPAPTPPAAVPTVETPAPTAAEQPQETTPPPIAESPFVGYVRVYAFTADGAEPLANARVSITRTEEDEQVLYANTATDADGFTPVVPLPTVDPARSLRPGDEPTFIPYDIRVTAEGFRPVLHNRIPIYGNNYVTLPAALVPLLPGGGNNTTQQFESGGPADL
ncbi:MAG: carboxypeptidase regulatory-like domain-containing protein [Clostridia bacterium]|nr:carboxypeptidase regulatory-like domain-containing protein [Clostridia bacterium]